MKKQKNNNQFGSLCFLPGHDLEEVWNIISGTLPSIIENWSCLIVTLESQTQSPASKKISALCANSQLLEHLVLKDEWEAEKVVPNAFKVLSAIKYVQTPYIAFMSGNTKPEFLGLNRIAKLLKEECEISAISGRILHSNKKVLDKERISEYRWFEKGQGIKSFGLQNLIERGVVYSVKSLKSSGVLDRFETNIRAHKDCPYMCLNILLAANHETVLSPEIIGTTLETDILLDEKVLTYFSHRSYGHRCDQLIALRNTLFESFVEAQKSLRNKNFNIADFYSAYVELCSRLFLVMIEENSKLHFDQQISIGLSAKAFSVFCLSAINNFPDYNKYDGNLKDEIIALADKCLKDNHINEYGSSVNIHSENSSLFHSRSALA